LCPVCQLETVRVVNCLLCVAGLGEGLLGSGKLRLGIRPRLHLVRPTDVRNDVAGKKPLSRPCREILDHSVKARIDGHQADGIDAGVAAKFGPIADRLGARRFDAPHARILRGPSHCQAGKKEKGPDSPCGDAPARRPIRAVLATALPRVPTVKVRAGAMVYRIMPERGCRRLARKSARVIINVMGSSGDTSKPRRW
jgi:hypothetical protein